MAGRRLNANDILEMLSDVDSDASDASEASDDDLGEPLCPGSDDDFSSPEMDSDDER